MNPVRSLFEKADFPQRGVFAVTNDFFARLAGEERALELVQGEDFRAVGTTRTRLRTLLWSLATFCPEAPLAAASEVIKEWDRWLNSRYNAKPTKTRNSCRVAVLPEEWPEAWRAGIPNLDRSMRVGEIRYRRLSPKGRASVIQAVGMMAAARDWAATKDVSLGEAINEDRIEVFARFLLSGREHRACGSDGTPGRGVTPRSAADYLERVRAYVTRSRLIDETGYTTLAEIIGALREEATETDPRKREKVRAFRRKFTLADVVLHAIALAGEAEAFPGHSEAAARRRRDAVVLALLVNTGDRQGDLSRHRIGIDLVRNADGLWETAFRQANSGRLKDNGSLWRITSQMIDTHILGDRPEWVLPDRLSELHGMNLVSLRSEGLGLYYPSRVLRGAFGISGHLVRTLIVDAIRVSRPDAACAAQFMLGHGTREMQEEYRVDFRELTAIRQYHETLEEIRSVLSSR